MELKQCFESLPMRPDVTKILMLCGGVGHLARLIDDAPAGDPDYRPLAKEVNELPEAIILQTSCNSTLMPLL